MTNPAAARGREVRQRLMRAAVELVPERGWPAVSTRVLAERAAVTPSVVHYHFPSLRALLTEAVVAAMRELLDETTSALAAVRNPDELLEAMLAALEPYDGRDPTSVLFMEAYLAATRDEQLRAAIGGVVAGFREQLAEWLGAHEIAAPAETAAVLAAAIDGVLLHRALNPGITSAAVAPVLRRLVAPGSASPGIDGRTYS
ncbi:TetR/AcrR family transcriptional regulator [Amycolatopsis sp. NPDC059021]|uniref:TetR/AcrR family transcriptional regulator n=1 Tax=Amycolatopsis sp. NPDC059021 TaxID=3346704 RepID=UPI00366B0396